MKPIRTGLACAAIAAGLAGCASQQGIAQNTETMLAAAGFLEKPADTPKRQEKLASLPPYRLLSQRVHASNQDTVGYVYADPQFCHCVYVGNAEAYSRFQRLVFQQHLVDQQVEAQEMAEDDAFGWGDWGPYPFWGGGGVVVVGGRGGFYGSGGFRR